MASVYSYHGELHPPLSTTDAPTIFEKIKDIGLGFGAELNEVVVSQIWGLHLAHRLHNFDCGTRIATARNQFASRAIQ